MKHRLFRRMRLSIADSFPMGLEITDDAVKLVKVRIAKDMPPQIKSVNMEPLSPGVVEEGRIRRPGSLLDVLRRLRQKSGKSRRVHLQLPLQCAMIRLLKLPDVPESAMKKLIDFEVKHRIYLPFSQPCYDFVKISGREIGYERASAMREKDEMFRREAAPSLEASPSSGVSVWDSAPSPSSEGEDALADVLLVAAPGEVVEEYASLVREAGFKPLSMEIRAFSLFRFLKHAGFPDLGTAFLIADINRPFAELSVFDRQQLQVTRTIPLMTEQDEGWDDRFLAEMLERLMNFYRYTLNHREREFSCIFLSGDVPDLDRIADSIKERLPQPVQVVSQGALDFRPVDSAAGEISSKVPAFAVAAGLALRGEET